MQPISSSLHLLHRAPAFVHTSFAERTVRKTSSRSTCGFRIKRYSVVDAFRVRHFPVQNPILSRAQQVSPQPQSEGVTEQPKPPLSRPSWKDALPNKPLVNRLLASRRLSLTFIITAALLYVTSACLIASTIANASLHGYQRILLFGLGVLLPDFRHTLIYYLDAVQDLYQYKPGFRAFAFSSKTKPSTLDRPPISEKKSEKPVPRPEFAWLKKASQGFHEHLRSGIQEGAEKFDKLVGVHGRELANGLTRPIRETKTHFQQFTIGTDITLRKNVLIAAVSILLSIAGVFLSTMLDPSVGGVSVMLASLLSSAVLSPRRHEMLALLNDGRIVISLVGTLSCVMLAFAPIIAAYCFFLCCVALVTTRFTVDWLKVLK
ncbi:unnamed protein product [Agarophyton chilense]